MGVLETAKLLARAVMEVGCCFADIVREQAKLKELPPDAY